MLEYLAQLGFHGEGNKVLKHETEEFAKMLIREVRDRSIKDCDMLLRPDGNSHPAKRWREKLNSDQPRDLAVVMIPDCVDDTLFYLLQAIDSGTLHISFQARNGNVVDLSIEGLGELAGWYAGSDSWRRKYSSERFIDDVEDLK